MAAAEPPLIALVGATGFTGGLVLEQMQARGVPVLAIGRSAERLAAVKQRYPAVQTRAVLEWAEPQLRQALEGAAAVISCAGPFTHAGRPVALAAVAAGIGYCDSTGEYEFIKWLYAELDSRARAAGVPLVPAFGFDFVPGDLGIELSARGLGPLRKAEAAYFAGTSSASRGTRRSIVEVIGAGPVGRLTREVDGRPVISFPSGEELMVPRHLQVDEVVGYIKAPLPQPLIRPLQAVARFGAGRAALSRLAALGPGDVPAAARERRWRCYVEVHSHSGVRRALWLQGSDVYGFTASSLTELALRMARGEVDATGACAPAQVVEPAAFLAQQRVTVSEVGQTS